MVVGDRHLKVGVKEYQGDRDKETVMDRRGKIKDVLGCFYRSTQFVETQIIELTYQWTVCER